MKVSFISKTVFVLGFAAICASAASSEKQLKMKESERAKLAEYLEQVRDSVQLLTTQYYSIKQANVDRKESDKEEFDKLREKQEKLNSEMARFREEILTREQNLDEEKKALDQKREEAKNEAQSIEELLKKEADGIVELFPLDRENRRLDLERERALLSPSGNQDAAIGVLTRNKLRSSAMGDSICILNQKIYPDEGEPRNMKIARFGNLFAYGTDTSGAYYIIRQTGRLGAAKYAVEKVNSPELGSYLQQTFPAWLNSGSPNGEVLLDVLQNDQSKALVSGQKENFWVGTYRAMEKGGLVMIPMLFLPLWALYIGFRKFFQIKFRGRRFEKQYSKVMKHLEKKDYEGAINYAKSGKGMMARVIQTCLERRAEERYVAERWVRDLIMQEIPILSRGINTVAVIAGAAPLLGLLGTISGMITLFAAVTHHGTGDPKFLAGGISEALITAKTGLAIAIPALFLHDYLRNIKEKLVSEIERHCIMIMNYIWPEE